MYKLMLILMLQVLLPCHLADKNSAANKQDEFILGNENLISRLDLLRGKRFAVITNQTGILKDGTHIVDALLSHGADVIKLFSPEHGIRGDESYSQVDEKTGIPIVSLYGSKKKPSPSDLEGIDIIIYDIQDVGARFYTYTSTLFYAIGAAVENNKQIIVCDRPVIINPDYVDGFMLEADFESFVGTVKIPVCYGMTCGELGNFINGEYFNNSKVFEVSKMAGYNRKSDYNSLNLKWVKPSPSMFYQSTAWCYPSTCFLEGTNVSEGRGTEKPFEYFGAPWVDSELLAGELNAFGLKGVKFQPADFTPSEKISDYPPKFFNKKCHGIFINVTDKMKFEPVKCGVAILVSLRKLFKEFKFDNNNFIDKLAGTDKLRKMILNDAGFNFIVDSWGNDAGDFLKTRNSYILY